MGFSNQLFVLGILFASYTQPKIVAPDVFSTETLTGPATTAQRRYPSEIQFGTENVRLSMAEATVLKVLGQPTQIEPFQDPNLPADIQLRRWLYPGLTLEVAGQEGKGYISAIAIESEGIATANGLQVRDSYATTLLVYGHPNVRESLGGDRTRLIFFPRRGGNWIQIDLEGDRVIRIEFSLST